MSIEIERKYLVIDDSYRAMATGSCEMSQAYLSADPDATVRVRISGDQAWLTVKSRNCGATRGEWEYAIPVQDARDMIAACCSGIISKTRWYVDAGGGLKWEVDAFHGHLEGLVVAEIELPSEDTPFGLPPFVGEEVTGDARYYNSSLCRSRPD